MTGKMMPSALKVKFVGYVKHFSALQLSSGLSPFSYPLKSFFSLICSSILLCHDLGNDDPEKTPLGIFDDATI